MRAAAPLLILSCGVFLLLAADTEPRWQALNHAARQAVEAKNYTKVIKAVRSSKSGAYTFKEGIIHKDKVKDFLSEK